MCYAQVLPLSLDCYIFILMIKQVVFTIGDGSTIYPKLYYTLFHDSQIFKTFEKTYSIQLSLLKIYLKKKKTKKESKF